MKKEMPRILDCNATSCAYNKQNKCHALAITVGDLHSDHPKCDTSLLESSEKAGIPDVIGSVGACKMDNCQYNEALECQAQSINVKMHEDYAECGTFRARSR